MTLNTIDLAKCRCDKGTDDNALMVVAGHICVNGQVAATISDVQFVATFGTCKVTDQPCRYAPATIWLQPFNATSFGGPPALIQGAKLVCVKTGIITILDPGQSTVCTEERVADIKAEIERLDHELQETVKALKLDLLGTVDPTPLSDGVSGIRSLFKGDILGAVLSGVSMIPYAGDALAKPAKGVKAARAVKRITDALDANRKLARAAVAADTAARHAITKTALDGKAALDIGKNASTIDQLNEDRREQELKKP